MAREEELQPRAQVSAARCRPGRAARGVGFVR